MIEKSNYDSPDLAYEKLTLYTKAFNQKKSYLKMQSLSLVRILHQKMLMVIWAYHLEMHFQKSLRMQSYQ